MRTILLPLCVFLTAAGVWLAVMEGILKHPGYEVRSAADASIAAQALLTLCFLVFGGGPAFRMIVLLSAVYAAVFGAFAMARTLQPNHFEGYGLLIGAALVLEAALILAVLFRNPARTA